MDIRHRMTACLLMIPLMLSACHSGSGSKTYPIGGKVTYQGAPLQEGVVTFLPVGSGNPSSASIEKGAFQLASNSRLAPGKYRVEIVSNVKTGKKIPGIGPDGLTDELKQVIPDRYNKRSELTIEVPSRHDQALLFDLQEH